VKSDDAKPVFAIAARGNRRDKLVIISLTLKNSPRFFNRNVFLSSPGGHPILLVFHPGNVHRSIPGYKK
jgi:hypothetical protein